MSQSPRLTDAQWARIQPLLPPPKRRGRPRADDRTTLDAILYRLKSGCRWCDIPRRYGDHVTAWRRLRDWSADGTWTRIWQSFVADLNRADKLDWERCAIDGSYVRAKGGAITSAAAAAA